MAKAKGIRAISIYRNYGGPTAQDEKVMLLATGDKQVLQKGLSAEPWRWGDVTEWERQKVLERFEGAFTGLMYDENPLHRLSTFDSLWAQEVNGWTDTERLTVEARVASGPGNGVDYIIVDHPKVPAPWPDYDNLVAQGARTVAKVAEKIVETTLAIGVGVNHVIAYERENLDRSAVVEALGALTADEPAEELIKA